MVNAHWWVAKGGPRDGKVGAFGDEPPTVGSALIFPKHLSPSAGFVPPRYIFTGETVQLGNGAVGHIASCEDQVPDPTDPAS